MHRAKLTLAVGTTYIAGGLWLDRYVDLREQLLLGLLTAAVFAALLALHSPAVRLQALAVVGIATLGEVIGSLVWGLYTYRLDNLPAFVPPGHGIVYLAGLSIATLMGRRQNVLLLLAGSAALAWGLAGITVLPSPDASGAQGCAFFVAVLLLTRRPVYAGVFLAVAALELYGTAIGTWNWASTVPGLGLSQGNPPSGAASGYVLFDVLALAITSGGLAGRLHVWRGAIRGTSRLVRPRASAARP